MSLRTRVAVTMAKFVSKVIKLLHYGDGAVLPGYVAQLLDPDILSKMSGMVRKEIIAVMGTNGKTTTNSIINHVLAAQGKRVVINRTGANMLNGIIGAFALSTDWKGSLCADYACIEVDENASVRILPQLKPDRIVITNLSRDQLDRYGEVDIVRNKLIAAIASVPDALLVLNSDDVLSYTLSYECGNPNISYGIDEQIFASKSGKESQESIFCRICGTKLEYDELYYGQLGIWRCPCCNAKRPQPDYAAVDVTCEGTYSFSVNRVPFRTNARAAYNVYNTLAAYAALSSIHAAKAFQASIATFDYGNNREDIFQISGSQVQLHLAKNPAGFQQKLSLILQDDKRKDIVIQINDTAQDGKDVSWLWDVDFQSLADANAASIAIGGTRRYDMGLRLKYEDVPHSLMEHMETTVKKLSSTGTGNLYVIVNYSGLYETRRLLTALAGIVQPKKV